MEKSQFPQDQGKGLITVNPNTLSPTVQYKHYTPGMCG